MRVNKGQSGITRAVQSPNAVKTVDSATKN